MSFGCPRCGHPHLEIDLAIELPRSDISDEVTLQTLGCKSCSFRGAAIYEESRRGAMDMDQWQHTGYDIDDSSYRLLENSIRKCPFPKDPNCSCESHQFLKQACSRIGLYQLEGVNVIGTFEICRGG